MEKLSWTDQKIISTTSKKYANKCFPTRRGTPHLSFGQTKFPYNLKIQVTLETIKQGKNTALNIHRSRNTREFTPTSRSRHKFPPLTLPTAKTIPVCFSWQFFADKVHRKTRFPRIFVPESNLDILGERALPSVERDSSGRENVEKATFPTFLGGLIWPFSREKALWFTAQLPSMVGIGRAVWGTAVIARPRLDNNPSNPCLISANICLPKAPFRRQGIWVHR